MRYHNPTPIRPGMTGQFGGHSYQVAGRLVLGVTNSGTVYYWQEFHLVRTDGGPAATLVFETTETGPVWRLFTDIDPAPWTLAEASAKRVGDTLEWAGRNWPIDYVDESQVYFIEGTAPEGVELGDRARFFNAQAGAEMVVVSWTGDEVEAYRGLTCPAAIVRQAFGLASLPLTSPPLVEEKQRPRGALIAVIVATGVLALYAPRLGGCRSTPNVAVAPRPAIRLALDQMGRLEGTRYRVTGRWLVETAAVGQRRWHREYLLRDDEGHPALLLQGAAKTTPEWQLLTPVESPADFTSLVAARTPLGGRVPLGPDSAPIRVTGMFQARFEAREGADADSPTSPMLYGLAAGAPGVSFVVRWDDKTLTAHRVVTLRASEVLAAFRAD